jgi:hypothetical protein
MRVFLSVMLIGSCVAGAALAQSQPKRGKMQMESTKEVSSDALASCLSQWEKSTHMSKREWDRACRRVANRLQNLTVK